MDVAAEIIASLNSAVVRIFSTMASLEVAPVESIDVSGNPADALHEVTGNVSFAGPAIAGVIYLSLPAALSRRVAGIITGDEAGVDEGAENDVLGEFTNMVTGNIKTHMADKGYNSALSIPNVLRGTSISVSCKGFTISRAFTFKVVDSGATFHVLALVKAD
ncbi:Chemotaxis protein CheX, a CheY~P-specific phosphatase [Verrucomicrobium sp. GAS474]|uniref:chemotaxis protein CheX n=1 Tax=Verrucomicrobium sp. GAS474 TaxID=1882831 RepID=UPI000879E304|nr:chemotaxis protein CheX [Verrucomicrobium sp. GAS474]SDU01854.1 Chemotaxis protein CheX, a CheY~P-specific phosphatase [Verrucomicrobium sp. GAS474]